MVGQPNTEHVGSMKNEDERTLKNGMKRRKWGKEERGQ